MAATAETKTVAVAVVAVTVVSGPVVAVVAVGAVAAVAPGLPPSSDELPTRRVLRVDRSLVDYIHGWELCPSCKQRHCAGDRGEGGETG